jgi:hypothetical protein
MLRDFVFLLMIRPYHQEEEEEVTSCYSNAARYKYAGKFSYVKSGNASEEVQIKARYILCMSR